MEQRFTGTAQLRVTSGNECLPSTSSRSLKISKPKRATAPDEILGDEYVCSLTNVTLYHVNSNHAQRDYAWAVFPAEAAKVTSLDTLAIVEWHKAYKQTAIVTVYASDTCGMADSTYTLVNTNPLLLPPEKPVGPTEVCATVKSSVYYVPAVPLAESYDWLITPPRVNWNKKETRLPCIGTRTTLPPT
ncbi:MAG: hypothetical protein HC896_14370 [Bacteroidales bacterium]|nr:hypothetical protein [Bacteroidales bacterium]